MFGSGTSGNPLRTISNVARRRQWFTSIYKIRLKMGPVMFLRALSFASIKHRDQRRKDENASPYINHPIAVATVLAVEGSVTDLELLIAAVLHDTVEDTETTFDELEENFGHTVADLVREVTDDKGLEKEHRKQLQIEHSQSSSAPAKQLKIADKICNLRDIAANPPADWSLERRKRYISWAGQVVEGCRGVNAGLDEAFDAIVAYAKKAIEVDA